MGVGYEEDAGAASRSDGSLGRVDRHKTALRRTKLSRPVQTALSDSLIDESTSVFDFGCGHGDDVRLLSALGIAASGWDPAFFPDNVAPSSAAVVNLGYVINVIEDEQERLEVVRRAWQLAQHLLIVSARLTREAREEYGSDGQFDGRCTRRNTFQRYYEQHELRSWLERALGEEVVAAAPGIFYVFRTANARERFNAHRFRRRASHSVVPRSTTSFRGYEQILAPLLSFVQARGRLPAQEESVAFAAVIEQFGSLKRAFRVIERATDPTHWKQVEQERTHDLLVYLALNRFNGRPQRKELPSEVSNDIQSFFGTYKNACCRADELLYSVGNPSILKGALNTSPVGKLTASALYVHVSALSSLDPVLRVYEGCARVLVGAVEEANVVKLHRERREISYLSYPTFYDEAHPALNGSLLVNLHSLRASYRDYSESPNPPILHRKEQFVSSDDERRDRFSALTAAEEALGLFEDTTVIGTRQAWEALLRSKGIRIVGHEVFTYPQPQVKG